MMRWCSLFSASVIVSARRGTFAPRNFSKISALNRSWMRKVSKSVRTSFFSRSGRESVGLSVRPPVRGCCVDEAITVRLKVSLQRGIIFFSRLESFFRLPRRKKRKDED